MKSAVEKSDLGGRIKPEWVAVFTGMSISASLATFIGIFLIPMFQRIFSKAVISYSSHKSIKRLIMKIFSPGAITDIKESATFPNRENLQISKSIRKSLMTPFLLNILIVAILSVGSLASLYAGYLVPEYRSTANSLHSIVNGFATVLLFLIVDPYLAGMTDDVVSGKTKETIFRKNVVYLSISRLIGTLLAQILLYPSAYIIAEVSKII